MEPPPELIALRSLIEGFARRRRWFFFDAVPDLGFELLDTLENFGYHCTPVNSVAFGATGGDGVHLSLVTSGICRGGVVLTTPVGDISNTVVAASFGEFLRLGYYSFFGWLEELGFDPVSPASLYREGGSDLDRSGRRLRDRLRETFDLRPIDDIERHFESLKERCLSHLTLPDQDDWQRRHGI